MKFSTRITLAVGVMAVGLGTQACGGDSFSEDAPQDAAVDALSLDSPTDRVDAENAEAGPDAPLDGQVVDGASPDGTTDAPGDVGPADAIEDAVSLDGSVDVSADVSPDVSGDAPEDGAADSSADVPVEAAPDSNGDGAPDASVDATADVQEAGWDATDFDAFAEGGSTCITGVDLPYCTNGSQAPWLVPMICSNNAWKPNAAEGECNYGCDTEGQCSCAAPVGRLLANIVSGPPQQRFITDTVTGYLWFFQPGWTGTMAQAEAFCAAGGYRIPWLDEAKTIMAQRLNAPYIGSVPSIHCKGKNTDPVISAASYWFKGHTDEWHQPGYGLFNPAAPSWTPVWQAPSDYPNGVICIKAADCHEGETRCAGTGTETCDASGHWQPAGACANGCLNGVCKCQLGEFRCSGTDPCKGYNCKADGSWSQLETVCFNWNKGCNPSTNQCDGIAISCH